jgi:hypothetical protein
VVHKARVAGRRTAEGVHLARTSYRLTATFLRRLVACVAAVLAASAAALLTRAVLLVAFGTPAGWWNAALVLTLVAVAGLVGAATYRSLTRARPVER